MLRILTFIRSLSMTSNSVSVSWFTDWPPRVVFIVGILAGANFGFIIMALMNAAGREDERNGKEKDCKENRRDPRN